MNLYLGLIHHPIKNKRGEMVTTSVTNMDIHDISRSSKTFGVKKYYIVTPLKVQEGLVSRILGHWKKDVNGAYNPDRQDALDIADVSPSLEEAIKEIEKEEGKKPIVVATGANFEEWSIESRQVKEIADIDNRPIFLIFGTGWGLHALALELSDHRLKPLFGSHPSGYNHLSVRSAVAIYLDRITT